MRWLIKKSLEFRYLIVFIATALVVWGSLGIKNMPIDVFPEFAPPYIEIQTEGMGMSAFEIESLVTVQLEEGLSNIPHLDVIRSKSVEGLSSVRLIFERGVDPLFMRQLVQERLKTVRPNLPIPADMPRMLQQLSSTSRALKIGFSSEEYSLMDLSMISYWTVVPRLMQVPGVANVAIWGERWQMLTVQADPERMGEQDVSLNEVMEVTSEALDYGILQYTTGARTQVGGFIDTPKQRLGVEHVLPVYTPEDLSEISIYDRKKADGTPLQLKDVSDVLWTFQPLIGDAVINDGPGLLLIVEKFPWGNTLEVTKGIEEILEELKPGLPGIDIDSTIFRPATFIETSITNLTKALILGIICVVFIILAFLWEWRIALISVIIIPISILTSLSILNLLGGTINVMVLAGFMIAIGPIVDDAIIDVENIVRRLRQAQKEKTDKSTFNVVLEASYEVRSVVVFASVIEVVALLPVFFMSGLAGAFFQPLAGAYVLAVLISPFIALTVTPALVMIMLAKKKFTSKESPFSGYLSRKYAAFLPWVIGKTTIVYTTLVGLIISGMMTVPFLGQELLPSFKESDFLMHWLTKPGTSHPEMYRITVQAGKELREVPGVRNFGAHIGRAIAADEVVGMYFTENWVSIDDSVDYDETLRAIQEIVDGYPGLVRDVQTYLKERIREVLTGASEAVVVRIYGPDLKTLRNLAKEVETNLRPLDGLINLHQELQKEIPQIQVEVDLEKAAKYRVKPGDVRRAVSVVMTGIEVSDILRDGKVYEVMIWSDPSVREDLTSFENLLIDTPSGERIKLKEVASIKIAPTPNVIKRENNSRRIDVEMNVEGRDLGAVARNVEDVVTNMSFPLGYHAEVLGEFKERQEAQKRMFISGIFAVIVVFFILQLTFNSWRNALLLSVILPVSLSGGIIAAYFWGGGVLSLGSLVGFFTVLAVATRNGIMLISHYRHLEEKEGHIFGMDLVLLGAQERLLPILMTTLATAFALIPLVIAGNLPGHEIEYPMAIVILGGLVSSLILNLFVLPFLYLHFGKSKK